MTCLSHRRLFETSITQDEKSSIIETISPSTKNPLPPVHKFFNISSRPELPLEVEKVEISLFKNFFPLFATLQVEKMWKFPLLYHCRWKKWKFFHLFSTFCNVENNVFFLQTERLKILQHEQLYFHRN